jgi:glycogen(starch) synthase
MLSRSFADPAARLMMTADAVGGVWQYALELAGGLAGHGIATTLAVLGPPPTPEQRRDALAVPDLTLVDTGLPLDSMAADAVEVRRTGRAIAELAKRHGADIVQLNGPALAADATFPAPVIAVNHSCVATWWAAVHGGPLPQDLVWRAELVTEGLHAAELNVAPTRAFANATARAHDLALPIRVVWSGRTPPLGDDDVADAIDGVFTAGQLWDEGKNIRALDRAAAHLHVPVFAAGPVAGPDGSHIECSNLHLLGHVDDRLMRSWLARRPIFVSTAVYEPFGLTILEAAQAGCALVLADIATFRELWDEAAIFVPPDDDFAIAAAIARLAGDRAHRRELGTLAAKRAQRYGVAAMVEGMLDAYRPYLDRAPFSTLAAARA